MAHRLQPMGHTFILFLHSLALLRNHITSASTYIECENIFNLNNAFIISYALSKVHHTSPVVFSE
jgi:hypothetical protein